MTNPTAPDIDAASLFVASVHASDAIAARQAWSAASVEPGAAARLARDADLMARLRQLSTDLAEQVRWELSTTLDDGHLVSRDDVFRAAARPAITVIGTGHPRYVVEITAAVHLYQEDVTRRLSAICANTEPDSDRLEALEWLAATHQAIYGRSLGESLSAGGSRYDRDRERLRKLFEGANIGPVSADAHGTGGSEQRIQDYTLRAASELITIAEAGASLLAATDRMRAELRSVAAEEGGDASAVETRVLEAMQSIGRQVRFLGKLPSELATALPSRDDKRAFLAAIGERKDDTSRARLALTAPSPQRDTPLPQTLIDLASVTGAALARAAGASQPESCLSAAEVFATDLDTAIAAGTLSPTDDAVFLPLIEAAYAPIGGDLRHGLARLPNADVIFRSLGYHSVGAALRESGDTRSNDLLAAEHTAIARTSEVFYWCARGDQQQVELKLGEAITGTAALVSVDDTSRTPEQALHDLYQQEFGISLATHITRDLSTGPAQDALLTRIGTASARPTPEAIDRVHPDFFTIPGESTPRIPLDPAKQTDPAAISAMAQHHVDALVPITVTRLDASLLLRYIGSLRLRGNAYDVVTQAFEQQTDTTLAFHVHRAEARGELNSETAESMRHSLEPGELSALAERVRTHAQSADWTGLLSVTEGASEAHRSQLLTDGQTMVVLRDAISDDRVWYALIDSLNGELDVSELLEQDTATTNWLEWGVKVLTIHTTLTSAILRGDALDSTLADWDASFDVDTILQSRREGMSLEERAHDAATMSVDGDVWQTLGRTVGEGNNRTTSDRSLEAGAARESTDPALDGQALAALGTGGKATDEAAGVDYGYWQLDRMRSALMTMSADERKAAAVNPRMLDRLDQLTAENPDAGAELFGILYGGIGRAEADREQSTGSGIDWRWYQHPWEAVSALANLSDNERALICLDSTARDAWIESAKADPAAQTQIQLLLDTATTAMSVSTQQGDSHPESIAFIVRATARLEAAAMDAADPQKALLEAAAAVAGDARQANATDPTSDSLTAEGWSVDAAMQSVWQRNHVLIYNTLTTVSSALNDRVFLGSSRSVDEASPDAGRGMTTPGISKAQMAMAEATLADWRTTSVGYAALAMYRVAGQAEDLDAMKAAIKQMSPEVFAAELTSLLRPSHSGDASLRSVYTRFETAWTRRKDAGPNSPDAEALAAGEESARRDLTTHPVGVVRDAALTLGSQLGGLYLGDQERIVAVINERIADLSPALVVSTIRADPQHAGLLWSPARPLEARIRAGRDQADRLLGGVEMTSPTTWAGALSETDDVGRARFDALGRGYQRAIADGEVTTDEASGVGELDAELGVSVDEFIAAKKVMAQIAVEVSTTVIAAIAGALTAGAGTVAVALLKTALSGVGQIAVENALMGDDNTSGLTANQLLGKLVVAGAGGMMGKVFERGSAAALSALHSSRAQSLTHIATRMLAASKSPLAEAGIAMAGGALSPVGDDISAAAGQMLDPSEWAYGFDQAWRGRVHEVSEAVESWPDEAVRGALTGLASHLVSEAMADDPSPSGRQLTGLVPPDPIREPLAYREYLAKRVKKSRSKVLSTLTEAAAEELVEQVYRESSEFVMTGDVDVDVDAVMAGLGSVGKKTGKKVLSEGAGAMAGAFVDRESAEVAHTAAQHHATRVTLATTYTDSMQPHER
ncbi:MAG: hypothetical protein ACJARS_003825 [bacterium]|jgi:hypothetical protein